eukprot:4047545-Prymnesium_polylepis.3
MTRVPHGREWAGGTRVVRARRTILCRAVAPVAEVAAAGVATAVMATAAVAQEESEVGAGAESAVVATAAA